MNFIFNKTVNTKKLSDKKLIKTLNSLQKSSKTQNKKLISVFDGFNKKLSKINSFYKNFNKNQKEQIGILELIKESSKDQLITQKEIAKNSEEQNKILERIESTNKELTKIARQRLSIQIQQARMQKQQLAIQSLQLSLQCIQLEQSAHQTKLQQIIANEAQLQTKLLNNKRDIELLKYKLDSMNNFFSAEVERLKSNDELPPIIKYLITKKYISYFKDNDEISDILSFLNTPFEFAFGSIINNLYDIKESLTLSIGKENIEEVFLNLKLNLIYENREDAKKSLEEYLLKTNILAKKSDEYQENLEKNKICDKQRKPNPNTSLPWFTRITKGFFSKKARYLYKEFDKYEHQFKVSSLLLEESKEEYEKMKSDVENIHQNLIDNGYPDNNEDFLKFILYITKTNNEFMKKFPYFENIKLTYNPFINNDKG